MVSPPDGHIQSTPTSLFRNEVVARRLERLEGNVFLGTPVAWQLISILLFFAVVGLAIFATTGTYARTAQVDGLIALNTGVSAAVSSRPGVVTAIAVEEGAHVRAGQLICTISAEEGLIGGAVASEEALRALAQQAIQLKSQRTMLLLAASADRARLLQQISGDEAEILSLRTQINDQKQLLANASRDFDNAKLIAVRGFVSKHDLDVREEAVLQRHQQVSQLEQLLAAKKASIASTEQAAMQSTSSGQAQADAAAASGAALSAQMEQMKLTHGYDVHAAVTGTVTGLTAKPGQAVVTGSQLAMIIPDGSTPIAELYVPTKAAGFLVPGQSVRLAIDSFPYEKFGTLRSTIRTISRASTVRPTSATSVGGEPANYYLVVAELEQPFMRAYGTKQRLTPGMALSARVVIERQSLVRWLFDPFYAVQSR